MKTFFFACTRGTDSITFAATDSKFNPMLEAFGKYKGHTAEDAYNAWATAKGVHCKCIEAKRLQHVKGACWQLTIVPK